MMTRFEKFYDGLCSVLTPVLIIALVFLIAGICYILSGRAMSDTRFYIFIGFGVIGALAVALWTVCSVVHCVQMRHGVYYD